MITFISTENLVDKPCPQDKGYPSIISPVTYFVGACYPEIIGYTSFSDMGDFYFVGNTYIVPKHRGNGYYGELLRNRNKHLNDKPKVTLANPLDNTEPQILRAQVAKQGGVEIYCYTQVCDIMTEETYNNLSRLPMFIYR